MMICSISWTADVGTAHEPLPRLNDAAAAACVSLWMFGTEADLCIWGDVTTDGDAEESGFVDAAIVPSCSIE